MYELNWRGLMQALTDIKDSIGASSGGKGGDFESEESAAIFQGNVSGTHSFAGYSRGAVGVRIEPGSTEAGLAFVQLRCRDTEDGLWLPLGDQVEIPIPAGGGFVEQRLAWSNQVGRDLYLDLLAARSFRRGSPHFIGGLDDDDRSISN
jgi:hypothetical protein